MTDRAPRVAKDPEDYVRRLNKRYGGDPRGWHFAVASVDGETPSGLKRYTLLTTVADPDYYVRLNRERMAERHGG